MEMAQPIDFRGTCKLSCRCENTLRYICYVACSMTTRRNDVVLS